MERERGRQASFSVGLYRTRDFSSRLSAKIDFRRGPTWNKVTARREPGGNSEGETELLPQVKSSGIGLARFRRRVAFYGL